MRLLGLLKGCFRIAQELLRDCSGSLSKRVAAVLECLWNRFGASWRRLEAAWKRLEASWKCLGEVLEAQKLI